jgi:cysteine synthase A
MKCNNILEAIGNTPLVRLNRVTKDIAAEVYVKADYLNPGGSVKDRIGISMIDEAERKGLLKPGGTIIEGTSGNTGMGLALVAVVRGYKIVFTITDKQSKEKIDALKAFGAEVIVCPTAVEPDDPRSYYSVAKKLAREIPNSFYPNQYENPMNPEAHYRSTGPEIWNDTEGKIDILVSGVGTGGTITGVSRYIKKTRGKAIVSVAVEPSASPVLTQKRAGEPLKPGPHKIQGLGAGFVPKVLDLSLVDRIEQVSNEEAIEFARRLTREEGILSGISCGAAAAVAARLAKQPEFAGKTIVTVLPDSGERYLSTVLFEGIG